MASEQLRADQVETQGGTVPEYEYPTTGKDEPIPVVKAEEPVEEGTLPPLVVGEEMPPFTDRDIRREEKLEDKEAGEWTENMAENYPRPGEAEDLSQEEREVLPSDRG